MAYEWKLVKARKSHVCAHCDEAIKKGGKYWYNRKNPHKFCERHPPDSEEVRASRRMAQGQRHNHTGCRAEKRSAVLMPKATPPPIKKRGRLRCPRCGNPLCETADEKILSCLICGYKNAVKEEPLHKGLFMRPARSGHQPLQLCGPGAH